MSGRRRSLLVVGLAALGLVAWTSAADVKITGTLSSKIQQFYGATGTNFIKVPDNVATALTIEDFENGGDLMTITTTNGSEVVAFPKPVTFASTLGLTGALGVTGAVTMGSTLGVTGAVGITGALGVTGPVTLQSTLAYGVSAAVTAAGTTKTDCTALTVEYNAVTTATALQGVCLLTASVGMHMEVYNSTAVAVILYPLDAGNDTLAVNDLAALTADTGYAMGPGSKIECTAYTTTAWHCTYVPGARSTVAAAGTNQATGTALGSATMGSFVAVTAADATKAVTLPTGGSASTYTPGCISIQSTVNTNTAYLPVFGNNSDDDNINGAANDAVFTMGAGGSTTFCTIDGVAWLTR